INRADIYTSILPTKIAVVGGQDVLLPVPQDKAVVNAFLSANLGTFTTAIGKGIPPRPASSIVIGNNLKEPWNPVPC
ncbi:MAG: hypothetical protein ACYDBS_09590, partial [Acidimicrobiales bacterium]